MTHPGQGRMLPVHHLPPSNRTMDRAPPPRNPFHLQLADLLVQAGDQGGVVPSLLVLAVAENAGGALRKSLLPSLKLPGMNFILGGQLDHRLLAFQRLQSHLGLERRAMLPASLRHFLLLPTATAVLSLGAGLSLNRLSEIPGPPQGARQPEMRAIKNVLIQLNSQVFRCNCSTGSPGFSRGTFRFAQGARFPI